METLAFQGLVGLSVSMYLWLLAAGLTIVFGVLGVLNFAHGSLFMLGAYFAFTYYGLWGVNFWLAIALSLLSVGVVGYFMERFFLRHIYHMDHAYQLLLTFGFILIFDDAVKMIWGGVAKIPPMPSFFEGTVSVVGRPFPVYNLFIIGAGLAVAIVIWLLFEKTWWGKMVRASASDREMASAIGDQHSHALHRGLCLRGHAGRPGGSPGDPGAGGGPRDRSGHDHPGLHHHGDRGAGKSARALLSGPSSWAPSALMAFSSSRSSSSS